MGIVSASRPKLPLSRALHYLRANGIEPLEQVALLGIRGYYLDSMGEPNVNDIGIYDDAIFIVGPEVFVSYNANTDPSRNRVGIATLLPGVYPYKKGLHGISRGNGYPALRPATPGERLPVRRGGETKIPSSRPGIAINIHRGGDNTTASEGCQTIVPVQWHSFIATVYDQMDRNNQSTILYCLLEEVDLRIGRVTVQTPSLYSK
jgi:lysozyme